MKNATAALMLCALIGQGAGAANLGCTVTRTHQNNANDIATHQVSYPVNEGYGQCVKSFLIPSSAEVRFGFEMVSRRPISTRLSLEALNAADGDQVSYDESTGSLTSIPAAVEVSFLVGKYSYSVSCELENALLDE